MQMVDHPEYNSTLILRSETINDVHDLSTMPIEAPRLVGLNPLRNVHRRLLPRRPGRDAPVEQHCTLYAAEEGQPSVLVLTPVAAPGTELPYYHPAVDHLALRYIPRNPASDAEGHLSVADEAHALYGEIEILVVPHDPPTAREPSSRLHRTCRALLETLHRYGWGAVTSYQKRVQHDRLVPREIYQDMYLVMRERHKKLVNTWVEGTDPLKHVFEVKKGSFVGPFDYLSRLDSDSVTGHWHCNILDASVEGYVRKDR
jgi:tRNASer (uridine44-2'-O)-methyltransferase